LGRSIPTVSCDAFDCVLSTAPLGGLLAAAAPYQPDILAAVINEAFRNVGPAEAAHLAQEPNIKAAIPLSQRPVS